MHPGMMAWWKHARHHAEHGGHGEHAHEEHAGCGPRGERGHGRHGEHAGWGWGGWGGGEHAHAGGEHDGDFGGGAFGVRRPLRFLAHKLELDEKQVAELARVLNELKTERAQAEVDNRRATAGFADAVSAESFDAAKLGAVASERVKSAERLRDAVVKALGQIHAVLKPEQRERFAYLIRTGALLI